MDYLITYAVTILLLTGCIWWNWSTIKLNSHSLHRQWLFWIAIIFPIYSCFYFGVIVWIEYPVEVSKKGYSDFLDISKLPLYLLAGSPILGAFVASTHRSLQTDIQIQKTQKQIEITEDKNNLDMYISKRKYISDQLYDIIGKNKEKIISPNLLFLRFFYEKNKKIYLKTSELEYIKNSFFEFKENLDDLLEDKSLNEMFSTHKDIDLSKPLIKARLLDISFFKLKDLFYLEIEGKPNDKHIESLFNQIIKKRDEKSILTTRDFENFYITYYAIVFFEAKNLIYIINNILAVLSFIQEINGIEKQLDHLNEYINKVNTKYRLLQNQFKNGDKISSKLLPYK